MLIALQQEMSGECSQADLAELLLQSESNLSTLLERMSGDGLITRIRSQTDRRRSLIRMTPLGIETLSLAERTRAATVVRLLRRFGSHEGRVLSDGLRQIVGDLEAALDIAPRGAGGPKRSLSEIHPTGPPVDGYELAGPAERNLPHSASDARHQ